MFLKYFRTVNFCEMTENECCLCTLPHILWFFRKENGFILCFDSICTNRDVLCRQLVAMQAQNGHRCVVLSGALTFLQQPFRHLPRRHRSLLPAAQDLPDFCAVADQDQHLSPAQGQPIHRFPVFSDGDPRRWCGCPYFFDLRFSEKITGGRTPFVQTDPAAVQPDLCQIQRYSSPCPLRARMLLRLRRACSGGNPAESIFFSSSPADWPSWAAPRPVPIPSHSST